MRRSTRLTPLVIIAASVLVPTAPLAAQNEKPAPLTPPAKQPTPKAPATPTPPPPPPAPATPAAPAPEAPAAEPVLRLIDAGAAEGRRAIRITPRIGTVETVVFRQKMAMNIAVEGSPSPATEIPGIQLTVHYTIDQILPSEDFRSTMKFAEVEFYETENVNPAVLQMMKSSLDKITGLTGSFVISDRGMVRSAEFKKTGDPTVDSMLDSMDQMVKQSIIPNPVEPVGVGASWEIKAAPTIQGLTTETTTISTLKAISADGYTLDIKTTVSAKEQQVKNDQLPPGVKVTLKSMNGSGGGEVRFVTGRVNPIDMQTTSAVDMTMEMAMGTMIQHMSQNIKMTMSAADHRPEAPAAPDTRTEAPKQPAATPAPEKK